MIKGAKTGITCLGITALLGDALLALKFTGNLLDDIMAVAVAILLSLFTAPLLMLLYKRRQGKALLIPLLIVSAFLSLYRFSLFAAPVMLKSGNAVIPFLIMLALALYLGLSNKKVLLKLSIIALVIVSLLIIIITAFSLQFVSLKYLLPHKPPNFSFLSTFLPLYLSFTSALLPIVVLLDENKGALHITAGFTLLFSLCVLNTLGIFGSEFAATLPYPYATAVSSAATGEIFSRLDGFFYIICFFCALIKTGAIIMAIVQTGSGLHLKIKA